VSSCAAGKIDGQIVLDPMKEEDNYGEADMPIAMVMPDKITLLQMDGHFTRDEFKQAFELAKKGCAQIYEMQRQALIAKYGVEEKQ